MAHTLPVTSTFQHIVTNGATPLVEHVDNLPPSTHSDEAVLYTEVKLQGRVSRVAVKVNKSPSCGCSNEKQMGISRDLMDRVESAVKRANEHIRKDVSHARNVRV